MGLRLIIILLVSKLYKAIGIHCAVFFDILVFSKMHLTKVLIATLLGASGAFAQAGKVSVSPWCEAYLPLSGDAFFALPPD